MILILAVLQTVADDATQPKVCIAPDGRVHVVLIRGGNIAVATSTDRGATFGEPVVAIDGGGRIQGGRQRGPRIGADAKGNLVVTAPACFDESEFRKKYPTAELWLVRSSDGGKTWSKPAQVNEVAKKAPEALHWMAVAADGAAHVAWLDNRKGGREQRVFYSRVGEKPGPNLALTEAVCECCAPGLALDGKGNPTVVVRGWGKKDREVLVVRSTDGGRTFSPPKRVNAAETNVDS